MFFKKLDMISPPITLYFKGDNIHSSIFSGILTIIAYLIIFICGVYYALEFINKENPTAFFFNRYIEDAGHFPLNASSLFHFVQLKNTIGRLKSVDFDIVRIIGVQNITIDNYPSVNLEKIPHWLYGLCNNDTDTVNIGHLITLKGYTNCVCIRQYYNPETKEYYDTNNNNFKWPSIDHGMSNSNFTYYGIIVEKCKEDNLRKKSGLSSCKSNDEIYSYIYTHAILVYLIDHYSDVLNYKNPFTKYLYSVSNMLFPNSYTVNNLNFNPAMIKTHNGIFFDNIVDDLSYFYSQNEKVTMEDSDLVYDEEGNKISEPTGIVSSYYFYMQNRLQYYERNYKRMQDTLSDIGGISRIVLVAALIINTLVSNYIILLDTEELALSLDNFNNTLNERAYNYKNINEIINPPKRQYNRNNRYYNNNQQQYSSNMNSFVKEDINIYRNINARKNDGKNNRYIKNNIDYKYSYMDSKAEKLKENKENEISEERRKKYYNRRNNEVLKRKITNKSENENKEEILNKPNQKHNFKFLEYIKYLICIKKNNFYISYYEDNRSIFLSEESIIQDHLNLYRLYMQNRNKKQI